MSATSKDDAKMPRYRSHKEVGALKIASAARVNGNAEDDVQLTFDDKGYAPIIVEAASVHRYFPAPGDYLVVYRDGYRSISPRSEFEDGYTRI